MAQPIPLALEATAGRGHVVVDGWREAVMVLVVIMDYQSYLVRDPALCGGEPVLRGTRVTVRTVLASLAEGATVEEIVADFPTLTPAAVRAVIAFAATSAREDLPLPAVPAA